MKENNISNNESNNEKNSTDILKFAKLKGFIGTLCFIVFGIVAFMDFNNPLNRINIGVGIALGFVFSFLSKLILSVFFRILNGDVKKNYSKKHIKAAISFGMVYLVPFSVMAFLASYYMHWTATSAFLSTGIMTVSALTAVELGKLKSKPSIFNSIAATVAGAMISSLWLFTAAFSKLVPLYVGALIKYISTFLSQMKG